MDNLGISSNMNKNIHSKVYRDIENRHQKILNSTDIIKKASGILEQAPPNNIAISDMALLSSRKYIQGESAYNKFAKKIDSIMKNNSPQTVKEKLGEYITRAYSYIMPKIKR